MKPIIFTFSLLLLSFAKGQSGSNNVVAYDESNNYIENGVNRYILSFKVVVKSSAFNATQPERDTEQIIRTKRGRIDWRDWANKGWRVAKTFAKANVYGRAAACVGGCGWNSYKAGELTWTTCWQGCVDGLIGKRKKRGIPSINRDEECVLVTLAFLNADINEDDMISFNEVYSPIYINQTIARHSFNLMDRDRDGFLQPAEFHRACLTGVTTEQMRNKVIQKFSGGNVVAVDPNQQVEKMYTIHIY